MKIITGTTGQPHVTSNNDGEFNQGIFGDFAVLQLGNCLKASVVDYNRIAIGDGDIVFQGRHALIEPDTTEVVYLGTGEVGFKRIDLIVVRYTMDASTGHENMELAVIEGNPSTGTPAVPEYTKGDIRRGALIAEEALYQVEINSVAIGEITPLFTPRSASLNEEIAEIKEELAKVGDFDSMPSASSQKAVMSKGVYTALEKKSNVGHTHTKSEVGLGNVDNTADANKTVNKAKYATGEALTTPALRNISFGTDEVPSTLASGEVYFQYIVE